MLKPALLALLLATPALAQVAPHAGRALQLTHSVTVDPSPSPDGAHLVHIRVVSGREQLFVMDADGAHPRQITFDDADHEDPAWSPKGDRIAYVLMKGGSEVIHLMNPDGSNDVALTPQNQKVIHPNWAPDGLSLAYCTDDDEHPPAKNTSDIWSIDIATRRAKRLITGGINTYPSWSPDGRRLAFRRIIGDMNSEVFVANADGSDARNITNHWSFDGWPAWSPDGTRIAFASNRNANYQIFVMKPDGSDVRLVANTEGRATAPLWSPKGDVLYFPICRKADFGGDCEIFSAPAP